jgi:hypothetical protein
MNDTSDKASAGYGVLERDRRRLPYERPVMKRLKLESVVASGGSVFRDGNGTVRN